MNGFPDDAARVAGCERTLRNVARDYTAGTDHGARSDPNTGQNQSTATNPDIRADLDRLSEFLLSAQLGIKRMQWRQNLHAGPEERVVADSHFAYIEHDAVEIEEYPCAKVDVRAVVAVERRLHPYGIATCAKQLLEDVPPFSLL